MTKEKGSLSVNTENIFPIIRKWLYSDRDIFLRELVSNSADAISKLKKLVDLGEVKIPENEEYRIDVIVDKDKKTIKVEDNGTGMTAEEIKKYINQIAFSGAVDFAEKYKDKSDSTAGIIGHFGLGFYSAFMVADKVRIDSLSFEEGAKGASWESKDGTSFEMAESDKKTRGTTITLEINKDSEEFLDSSETRKILGKYCSFMPFPIYYLDVKEDEEKKKRNEKKKADYEKKKKEKEKKDSEKDKEDEKDDAPYYEDIGPEQINDTQPLWLKNPKDCTDEEYKEFYRKAFSDYREPLFWIHLNMDYPFNLKGILYFPQSDNTYESLEGRIKLYYNQVFVADNIKEVIPEFLFLLKGSIDCPDLPLNVSRSFLQNDRYVKKLSSHIIKKVADKLTDLYKKSREDYNKYWSDIGVFVKYGCMREDKFYEKVKDIILSQTVDGEMKSLEELGETVFYTNDAKKQAAYVEMAKSKGKDVVVMDHEIDNNFMSFMEYKNNKIKFKRVDSEIEGEEGPTERKESFEKLFREATGNEKLNVQVKSLGENSLAAVLSETEESRRMQEMQKMYIKQMGKDAQKNMGEMFNVEQMLIINTDSPLAGKLSAMYDIPGKEEKAKEIALHLYDLALLSHGSLDAKGMTEFLSRNTKMMEELAD